jgi:hypothetical protein
MAARTDNSPAGKVRLFLVDIRPRCSKKLADAKPVTILASGVLIRTQHSSNETRNDQEPTSGNHRINLALETANS